MGIIVEIIGSGNVDAIHSNQSQSVVEIVSSASTPVTTIGSGSVVEVMSTAVESVTSVSNNSVVQVVGPPVIANAIVSETPPADPHEGQIWIDIS